VDVPLFIKITSLRLLRAVAVAVGPETALVVLAVLVEGPRQGKGEVLVLAQEVWAAPSQQALEAFRAAAAVKALATMFMFASLEEAAVVVVVGHAQAEAAEPVTTAVTAAQIVQARQPLEPAAVAGQITSTRHL